MLKAAGSWTGPELSIGGAPITVGMWPGWTPIGAVQTSGGYDVAWKNAYAGQFNLWSTDSNGNYITNLVSLASATSPVLSAYESVFQQDLNGDGTIGPSTVVIQTDGSTSLVQSGITYLLNPVGGGSGPELYFAGAPVTAGMWAGWAPIGAVQASGGYDVAWKNTGTGQFNIWSTDSSGHYNTNLLSFASATSTALESYETTFQQDFNGDGTIGIPTVVIQTDGSTSLVQAGPNYFLNPVGGTGPELYFSGAPVTAGMWAGWAPIGAVQTSGGYDVAWKNAGTRQFNIWSTDSTGHYITNLLSFAAATSTAAESYETTFQQGFNGDGTIGMPVATAPAASAMQTTFNGEALTLDAPSTFSGQLLGFGGDTTLAGSDQVDLRGLRLQYTAFELRRRFRHPFAEQRRECGVAAIPGTVFAGQLPLRRRRPWRNVVIAATPTAQATVASRDFSFRFRPVLPLDFEKPRC